MPFHCFRCKHCSFLTRNDLGKPCFLWAPKAKAVLVCRLSVGIIIFMDVLPTTEKQPGPFNRKLTWPLPLPTGMEPSLQSDLHGSQNSSLPSSLNTLYDSGSRHWSITYVSYLYFCVVRSIAAVPAFIEGVVLYFFFLNIPLLLLYMILSFSSIFTPVWSGFQSTSPHQFSFFFFF